MASYNRVILVGNLTRDPELRYTPSGTAVTEVGLAINDKRKGANGEWIEETTFVEVTLWGRTAEVATEYLNKGAPLMIEGRLKFDQWQDKDGQKRSKLRVVGERMQMLGTKGGGGGGGQGGGGGSHAPAGGRSASRAPAYDESEYGAPSDQYGDSGGAPSAGHPPEDEIPF
jgi:single-strand DNA-binding protein